MWISKGTVEGVVSRTIMIAATFFGGDSCHSISFALCADNGVALDIDLLELGDTVLQGRLHLDWLCFGGNLTLSFVLPERFHWICCHRRQTTVCFLFWDVILVIRLVSLFGNGETYWGSTRTCSNNFVHLRISLGDMHRVGRGLCLELGSSGEEDLLVHRKITALLPE